MKAARNAISLSLVASMLLLPAAVSQEQGTPEAKERKALEGVWRGFVVEARGENPNRGPVKIQELVIMPDRITARDQGNLSLGEGGYRLDPRPKMKTIDATGTAGQARNKTYLGIYTVEGDTLKWCVSNPGQPRPSDFVTRAGDGQYLMVLTRQKR